MVELYTGLGCSKNWVLFELLNTVLCGQESACSIAMLELQTAQESQECAVHAGDAVF